MNVQFIKKHLAWIHASDTHMNALRVCIWRPLRLAPP